MGGYKVVDPFLPHFGRCQPMMPAKPWLRRHVLVSKLAVAFKLKLHLHKIGSPSLLILLTTQIIRDDVLE